jgi:CopG antitoxin of type II toxin-antitoxin system
MRKNYAKTVEEFDARVDAGEDVFDVVDPKKIKRIDVELKHATLDLPAPFMEALDRAAARRGVTRQSLIKMWLYERVMAEPEN